MACGPPLFRAHEFHLRHGANSPYCPQLATTPRQVTTRMRLDRLALRWPPEPGPSMQLLTHRAEQRQTAQEGAMRHHNPCSPLSILPAGRHRKRHHVRLPRVSSGAVLGLSLSALVLGTGYVGATLASGATLTNDAALLAPSPVKQHTVELVRGTTLTGAPSPFAALLYQPTTAQLTEQARQVSDNLTALKFRREWKAKQRRRRERRADATAAAAVLTTAKAPTSSVPSPTPPPPAPVPVAGCPVAALGPQGRIDEGVDYAGAGPVYAIGPGVVTYVNTADSWPGGTFVAYSLTGGPWAGEYVYIAEDFSPAVSVGQQVSAGTLVGQALGGTVGIEIGWAMAPGTIDEAAAYNHYTNGVPTPEGYDFQSALAKLGCP